MLVGQQLASEKHFWIHLVPVSIRPLSYYPAIYVLVLEVAYFQHGFPAVGISSSCVHHRPPTFCFTALAILDEEYKQRPRSLIVCILY
jgi:hypothetical protein